VAARNSASVTSPLASIASPSDSLGFLGISTIRPPQSAASGSHDAVTKQSTLQYQVWPAWIPTRPCGAGRIRSLLWQVLSPHRARTRFHPKSIGGNIDWIVSFMA
jgi:hypothetical protein